MEQSLLVVVMVVPLLLVLAILVVALVAWAVLRPAEGEPPARARLRLGTGVAAATATAVAVVWLLPSALLGLRGVPELAGVGVLLAGLSYVVVLWCGEAMTARPRAARRTALLGVGPRSRTGTTLAVVLAAGQVGLLLLLVMALLPVEQVPRVPPRTTTLVVVPGLLLGALVVLAVRQVRARSTDARLHPEVDAAGKVRATHRLLRAGAAATCAALGLLVLVVDLDVRQGDGYGSGLLVLGGVLLLVSAVVSVLPVPALPLRPDAVPETPAGSTVDAGATTGGD